TDLYPGLIGAYYGALLNPLFYDLVDRVGFLGKLLQQIMQAAFADIHPKNSIEYFLHSGKGHVLPGMEISNKGFYIFPITYRSLYPLWKLSSSLTSTITYLTEGLIFCIDRF